MIPHRITAHAPTLLLMEQSNNHAAADSTSRTKSTLLETSTQRETAALAMVPLVDAVLPLPPSKQSLEKFALLMRLDLSAPAAMAH
jgi:hypothetical protein